MVLTIASGILAKTQRQDRILVVVRVGGEDIDARGQLDGFLTFSIARGLEGLRVGRIVTHRSLIRFLEANSFGPESPIPEAAVVELAKLTKANRAVLGVTTVRDGKRRLEFSIVDTINGKIIDRVETPLETDRTDTFVDAAVGLITTSLIGSNRPEAGASSGAIYPSPRAYGAFESGLRSLAGGQFSLAAQRLEEASTIDPSFIAARTEAINLYLLRYNIVGIKSGLSSLETMKANLLERELVETELARAESVGDLPIALSAARRYVKYVPEDQYPLGLFALRSNRLTEALRAFRSNPATSPFTSRSIDHWSQYIRTLHMLGRFEEERAEAANARERFPNSVGTAWYEVRALIGLRKYEEAIQAHKRIQPFPDESPTGDVTHWSNTVRELRAHGARDRADVLLNRIIETAEGSYSERQKKSPAQLATLYELAGRWSDALPIVESQLKDAAPDAIWEQKGLTQILGCLNAKLGQMTMARQRIEELDQFRGAASPDQQRALSAGIYVAQGIVYGCMGERAQAVKLIKRGMNSPGAAGYGFVYGFGPWIHREIFLEDLKGYGPFKRLMRPR